MTQKIAFSAPSNNIVGLCIRN